MKLFRKLNAAELQGSWFAVHSLNVSEHQYKHWSELDFVVVGPPGLFVLEVKGGRISRGDDGLWNYKDRYDRDHRSSEGPFDQAKSGMEALIRMMRDHAPTAELLPHTLVGHGVVFPDIPFDVDAPDMPREIVCDSEYFAGRRSLRDFIRELSRYWRGKLRGKRELEKPQLEVIRNFLVPAFDLVPSLGTRVGEVYETLVRLTEGQHQILEAIRAEPRILCHGGAGTGKTFLALETARRDAETGDRNVLVLFPGPVMAAYAGAKVTDPRIKVMDVATAERNAKENPALFDEVVVDEGQDILTLEMLEKIGGWFKGGFENGRWRWFMDHNNQSHVTGDFDSDAADLLDELAAVHPHLERNCRNTETIISNTQQSTGADIGITSLGKGPAVIFKKTDGKKDEAALLEKQIREWMDKEVPPHDIVVLTAGRVEDSAAQLMSARRKKYLARFSSAIAAERPRNKITLAAIEDFKGLESRFIALVDLDALSDDEKSRGLLYVGMTRAHAGLWIGVGDRFGPLLRKWQEEALGAITEGLANA